MARRLSEKKLQLLRDLVDAGHTLKDIAAHKDFNCSVPNVSGLLKQYNIKAARFRQIEEMKKAREVKTAMVVDRILDALATKGEQGDFEKEGTYKLAKALQALGDDSRQEKLGDIKQDDLSVIAKALEESTNSIKRKFKKAEIVIDAEFEEMEEDNGKLG